MPPVNLCLLAGQCSQAQIGLGRLARPDAGDDGAKVIAGSRITALFDHGVNPAGGQGRKLFERSHDERHERVRHRVPTGAGRIERPGLGEDPLNGRVMNAELPGDSADTPLLGVMQTQNLRFSFFGDGHGVISTSGRAARLMTRTT